MNKTFLRLTFAGSLLLITTGGWLKIIHVAWSEPFLIVGLFATWFFLFVFIFDVARTSYTRPWEKFQWIAGFIFLGWFAAFLYLIKYRRMQANT